MMNIESKKLNETILEKVKHRKFLFAVSGLVVMAIIAAMFVDWEDLFDDDGGTFIALASCVLVGVVVFMLWIFNRDCKKVTGKGLLATTSEKVRGMTLEDVMKGVDNACHGISDAKEAIGGGVRSRAVGIINAFNSTAKAMTILLREPMPAAWGILCGGGVAIGMFMLACHAIPSGWGIFGICIAVVLVLVAAAMSAYFLSACIALVIALMGRRIDLRQMKAVLIVAILAAVVPLGMFVKGCWHAGMEIHENAEEQNGKVIVNWHPYKVALCAKKMGYFTKKGYLAAYRYTLPDFDKEMEKAGGFAHDDCQSKRTDPDASIEVVMTSEEIKKNSGGLLGQYIGGILDGKFEEGKVYRIMNRIYLKDAPRIFAIGEDHIQILCQGDNGVKILNVAVSNPGAFCAGDEIQSMDIQYIGIFGEGPSRHHTFRRVLPADK